MGRAATYLLPLSQHTWLSLKLVLFPCHDRFLFSWQKIYQTEIQQVTLFPVHAIKTFSCGTSLQATVLKNRRSGRQEGQGKGKGGILGVLHFMLSRHHSLARPSSHQWAREGSRDSCVGTFP